MACCEETEGMPLTDRPKSGLLFSMAAVSNIVPASVIYGVTVKLREKSTNVTAIVLFTFV